MSKTYEQKMRAAIEAELFNGNWLYLGKGDPVGHVLRAVKSALVVSTPPKKQKKASARKKRK